MTEGELRQDFEKRAREFALRHSELEEWARMSGDRALVTYIFSRPSSMPWGWEGLRALRKWGGPKVDQLYRELCADFHCRMGYPAPGRHPHANGASDDTAQNNKAKPANSL